MESLELVAAEWPDKPSGARAYDSDHFRLVCTGTEELTRRSAVRLEQIYTAFARFLPPTVPTGRPTVFMLATDPTEYKTLLGPLNESKLLNPAVYDPATNRILCGSDLARLGAELQSARVHHAQQLASLDRYEGNLRKLYKGEELERHLKAVTAERKRVFVADVNNGMKFTKATVRLFALLYHEAFHAYVATFAYPPLKPDEVKAGRGSGELPRWLYEGLAQVFETAVVEVGELRADHPDKERLQPRAGLAAREERRPTRAAGRPARHRARRVPRLAHGPEGRLRSRIPDLLGRSPTTSRSSRRLIGTDSFRKYLIAVNSGENPKQAFAKFVGQELPAFEKDWHAYLVQLQPNGTRAK